MSDFTDLTPVEPTDGRTFDEPLPYLILEQAAGALAAWLSTHCGPHAMIIITTGSMEVFEGQRRFSISPPAMPDPALPDHLG